MAMETGILVGGVGIVSACIAKVKCKKTGYGHLVVDFRINRFKMRMNMALRSQS